MIYFGNTKDEVLKHFVMFKESIETQIGNRVKRLHSDNEGEYINKQFKEFCASQGNNSALLSCPKWDCRTTQPDPIETYTSNDIYQESTENPVAWSGSIC